MPDQSPAIVGIGEALFDVYPDRAVLGGAPLNFAVHAHDLLKPGGRSAGVVSRVGSDDLGRRVLDELRTRGVPEHWVQIDPDRQTGKSIVTLKPSGDAEYEIVQNVAWDAIQFDESLAQLAGSANVICFNTLSQRSPISREAVRNFVAAASGVRLFDINLRQDFYSPELIEWGFTAATHAKLNQDEFKLVQDLFGFGSGEDPEPVARRMIERFDLKLIALTRGSRGTILITHDRAIDGPPVRYDPAPNADTVGAGDACNAGLAVGLMLGMKLEQVVSLANHCGAYVASRPGATPRLPRELLESHGLVT